MDEQHLSAIRARLEAATPGPWEWEDWEQDGGPNRFTLTSPPETREGGPSTMFPDLRNDIIADEDGYICGSGISEADREFIAHAPTDIAALLAEVERLRGELGMVDAVLARRPAIDDIPDRIEKIQHALRTAARAEP